jgi:anti-sigma factor ChrR (cupin superfamily)
MQTGSSFRIHADFAVPVVERLADAEWRQSPMPGVERRMLDRIGGEVARATSIVRYAPDSRFSRHVHGGGEEFLVLEGVFSDEAGDCPVGTYVRNPPGTSHAPFSVPGCTIFVKLWQFQRGDTEPVRIDTRQVTWPPGTADGRAVLTLHVYGGIVTSLERWAPGARPSRAVAPGGEEMLVLEGSLHDAEGDYPPLTWIRRPDSSLRAPSAGPDGALVFVKTGHLGADWLPLPAGA